MAADFYDVNKRNTGQSLLAGAVREETRDLGYFPSVLKTDS